MTTVENFRKIVAAGQLLTQECPVFKHHLLYLSYGLPLYKPTSECSRDSEKSPVAIMFRPDALVEAEAFYPLDTGAAAKGRYGRVVTARSLSRFRVSGARDLSSVRKLVREVYQTNERFDRGQVDSDLPRKPRPLPTLARLLTIDRGQWIDGRQCAIECVFPSTLSLRHVFWIGVPEECLTLAREVFPFTDPNPPTLFRYPSRAIIDPARLLGQLTQKAREACDNYFEAPPYGAVM